MDSSPWDPNVWFSPRYAIEYFWEIANSEGERSITSRKYQKEREAWIVAVALLAIIVDTGTFWWLQIPKDDPPDVLCMTMTSEKGLNVLNEQHVEVMEITEYSNLAIADEILRKLSRKSYPKNYVLIVYLRRSEELKDIREIASQIKLLKLGISAIWIIGSTDSMNSFKNIVFSVYPKVKRYDLDIMEAKNALSSKHLYLKVNRGTGNKWEKMQINRPYRFIP